MKKKLSLSIVFLILSILIFVQINQNIQMQGIFTKEKTPLQLNSKSISLGGEIRANSYRPHDQTHPEVCFFPNGSFVIVWQSYQQPPDSDSYGIFAKIFNSSGVALTDDILVNSHNASGQSFPSVYCFSNNSFVIAWQSYDQDGNIWGVFAKVFNSTGTNQTNDILVNNYTTNVQQSPEVCGSPDGYFWVAWEGYGPNYDVFVKKFDQKGNNHTHDIQINVNTTGVQKATSICCRSDGSIVVVWNGPDSDLNGNGVSARIFDSNGNNLTDEFLVNTEIQDDQQSPSVCCFPNGSFVVVWMSQNQDLSGYGVYTKIFNSTGNNITNEIRVNDYTQDYQGMPSVCCLTNYTFIATWQSDKQLGVGYKTDIFAKYFHYNGNKLTDEIQVNTYINDVQEYPSISCFNNDTFIIVWDSNTTTSNLLDVVFRIGRIGVIPSKDDEFPILLLFILPAPEVNVLLIVVIIVVVVIGVIAFGYWWWKEKR